MIKSQITNSFLETQKVGQSFAAEILASGIKNSAMVLALQGDLGAGKTTFLQGFAKGLGIKEKINSPTFVIMKKFEIPAAAPAGAALARPSLRAKQSNLFKNFYHVDLYRLHFAEEILSLNFKEIISNPQNIVAVEWPEKISDILLKNIILINFIHSNSTQRVLNISARRL